MKNLKNLLTQPLQPLPISLVGFLLVIALLGFADATYLTVEHFRGVIPPCTVISGCETVLTSSYSEIAGIPVSLAGSVYYLLILIGVFSYLEGQREKVLRYTLAATVLGFLASLYFVFLQVFVIKAYCMYCMGSVITSTILFVTAMVVFSKYRKTDTLSA